MTHEQIARAVWHQNSPSTMILKCRVKDGSEVLAGIQDRGELGYSWGVTGQYLQLAKTRHTAMRRARKALR